ncbi:baculoviral IAP repeat-containing protein 7-like [Saccoglossus kowalevskii]|uniref:Baculoviral IAP repeat-containing protein 2-like n=1 Tax=Saccoglossus kowalevskii TaxID=10224 RepID=A0ABM0M4C8_SACKO|nr:PREDICTED: baculoviral IAP repeat-containing protein 2-like [Saccoglossus kowalevskii]
MECQKQFDDDCQLKSSTSNSDELSTNIQIGDSNVMHVNDASEGACYIPSIDESDGTKSWKDEKLKLHVEDFPVDMNSEAIRLASYRTWPHSSPVNPSALARAGMFYTGNGDMVECFSCHGQIKEWDFGDTAMGEHKRLFPDCAFVNGKNTNNIPLIKPPSDGSLSSTGIGNGTTGKENGDNTGEGPKKGKKKKKKKKKKKDDEDEDEAATTTEGSSIYNMDDDPLLQEANRVLKSEYKRLLTYIYWPKNAAVLPEDLSRAGFYYCGSDDRAQCFSCSGILKNWSPGDVPMVEHRRYFPNCPFIRGLEVGNEPMRTSRTGTEYDDLPRPSKTPSATLQARRTENLDTSAEQTARYTSNSEVQQPGTQNQARHPEYSEERTRIATYTNWSENVVVSPVDLAKAGFYYTGVKDNVKCFYCDGGLRNWEPTDEPWIEHARWFPKCAFVLQQRGSVFMKYVTSQYPQPYEPHLPADTHQYVEEIQQPRPQVQPRANVNDVMRSDLVQVVMDMGYDRQLIKNSIKRKIRQTGESFSTTHELLLAVWDYEASGEQEDEDEDDYPPPPRKLPGEKVPDEPLGGNKLSDSTESRILKPPPAFLAAVEEPPSGPVTAETLQRQLEDIIDEKRCKVCMDRDRCMLFQPCRHVVTCEICSAALRECPICRKTIKSTVKIYMS